MNRIDKQPPEQEGQGENTVSPRARLVSQDMRSSKSEEQSYLRFVSGKETGWKRREWKLIETG